MYIKLPVQKFFGCLFTANGSWVMMKSMFLATMMAFSPEGRSHLFGNSEGGKNQQNV